MALKVFIEKAQLANLERRLTVAARGSRVEIERAMVSVSRATFTESKRAISTVYNIAQGRVGGPLSVRLSGDRRGFVISGNPTPITFASYGARVLGRGGLSVAIFRKSRKRIAGGFKAKSPQGAELFWIRTGQPPRVMTRGRYAGKVREPIRALTGPSVADHLNNDTVSGRIRRFFITKSTAELQRRIGRLLARRR